MAAKSKWYQILLETFILLVVIVLKFLPAAIIAIPEIHEYAINTLISFLVFWLSLRLIVRLLKWWYRKRTKIPADKDDNVTVRGKNYKFENGKHQEFIHWENICMFLDELIDVLDQMMDAYKKQSQT